MPESAAGRRISARRGFLWALTAPLPAVFGLCFFLTQAPRVGLARLQLAGSAGKAFLLCGQRLPACQDTLTAYYWLIVCIMISLLLVFRLASFTYATRRGRYVSAMAMALTVAAAVCGLLETALLQYGLDQGPFAGDGPFAGAAGLATVKWLLASLTVLAFAQWITTLSRAGRAVLRAPWQRLTRGPRPAPGAPRPCDHTDWTARPQVVPPWPVLGPDGTPWPSRATPPTHDQARIPTHWLSENANAPGRENAELGFCVSGGGIRSACVSLGALQALRPALMRARYLVSVSGGGYTAGAMQLALSDHGGDAATCVSAKTVCEPGSVEEDHLRRHSKYIADGTGQWLVALGVLLRGLLASLFLLSATTATLGLALSWAYHLVPITDLGHLAAPGIQLCSHQCTPPPRPGLRTPAVWSFVGVFLVAAVVWLAWLFCATWWRIDTVGRRLARLFRILVVVAVALATLVVLLPLLAWAAVHLQTGLGIGRPAAGASVGATVLITYVAALVTTLWRRRQTVRKGLSKVTDLLRGKPGLARAVPNGFVQYVLVWFVLALLTAGFLLLLGWSTATGWSWPLGAQIGVPGILLVLGSSLDQTWMSLHPFYRRRLASCFAVRRIRSAATGGVEIAEPYDFDHENTSLSTYGARRPGFPQVIFAAAANLSGEGRTPPGRRAVSFTLSHDYVGSPAVGYACTRCLEQHTKRHIARDLTTQSAIAVSGAAFASAMGAQARAFQTFFALSNARLGTWLPNPAAMAERWQSDAHWELPPPPAIRRLPYLLREVFGRYPIDDRLLLVTDGGHYENLGLVELLRQGVRTAVCIDASGDTPPFATTLAQAITLAHEELGITVTLHDPTHLVPGSGDPLKPPSVLSALNTRLSRSAVVTGDILYPHDLVIDGRPGGRRGRLVVARATLTGDLPYELLSYASSSPVFPHDSTSDQWFDHRQFDAYQGLGRCIGRRVQSVLTEQSETAEQTAMP
ncbi:hypothetical protein [Streptomyces sp. NPDC046197]|uniref:hypothetical protein n=1 Tax=Streptomyces sp. NPDC046197 TaxID=3154337 RepID=UPI0033EF2CF3